MFVIFHSAILFSEWQQRSWLNLSPNWQRPVYVTLRHHNCGIRCIWKASFGRKKQLQWDQVRLLFICCSFNEQISRMALNKAGTEDAHWHIEVFLTRRVSLEEFNWRCSQNLPWLFHVLLSQLSPPHLLFLSPFLLPLIFFLFLAASSFLCLLHMCVTPSLILPPSLPALLSPPVLWPLTAPPYHLLLNEYAASSFANNQCRQYTKEHTKLLYSSPESFLDEAITGEEIGAGPRCKATERERERGREGEGEGDEEGDKMVEERDREKNGRKGQARWQKRGGGWESIGGGKGGRWSESSPDFMNISRTIAGIKYSWPR